MKRSGGTRYLYLISLITVAAAPHGLYPERQCGTIYPTLCVRFR